MTEEPHAGAGRPAVPGHPAGPGEPAGPAELLQEPGEPRGPGGPAFAVGLTVGCVLIAFGVAGAWTDRPDTHPFELAGWVLGAGVAHDAVVAPVAVALVWATTRVAGPARTPLRLGLGFSALIGALAWPLIRSAPENRDNASLLPLDYDRNLALVLGAVWFLVAVATVLRLRRARLHGTRLHRHEAP